MEDYPAIKNDNGGSLVLTPEQVHKAILLEKS